MSNAASYTAANSMPLKVIQDEDLVASVKAGFIPLRHLQFLPTNRCNLSCSYCSCSERDMELELSMKAFTLMLDRLSGLGCRSVTITGGGEPLLHPDINVMIRSFGKHDIKVGLVTNGTQFRHIEAYSGLTWCRISVSDCWGFDLEMVARAVEAGPSVDWAFSYVLTRTPDWLNLARMVAFANDHGFTHVRLVGDILDPEESGRKVGEARAQLAGLGIDDRLVIYQPRADFTKGDPDCLISLLKPVVGADGYVYPCCGVQYAQDPPGRDLVESMRMGHMDDLETIWRGRHYFNGLQCTRCYYGNYNLLLGMMSAKLTHVEFV